MPVNRKQAGPADRGADPPGAAGGDDRALVTSGSSLMKARISAFQDHLSVSAENASACRRGMSLSSGNTKAR
ncbi:hypothetical protein [Streptomyces sp. NPDC050564]|uniref:hypothetical protein n=1 Tax=Streptomyces sp. NPDC050564 TaxID=3365631 RepID=UPI00379E52AD